MKTERNRQLAISLIFIMVIAVILTPVSRIFADDSVPASSGNSGGFIVETAKVDGKMDLIGALTGNITIYEGEIHNLTITKVMERGKGLEPLVIRITSPGPIPVKNLNAQTMNHELPNIGGLCKPSQPGWICMENVVMNVEAQFVESISLTEANVHTCYVSECGALPEYNPLISLEQLEEIINGKDDQSDEELQEIIDLIEEQEELGNQVKGLFGEISEIINELLHQDYVGKIKQMVVDVENAVTNNLGLEELLPNMNKIPSTLEYVRDQIQTSKGLLEESETLMVGLERGIPIIEKKITVYEKQYVEILNFEEQIGAYAILIKLAKMQEAGKEIDYSLEKELEEQKEADDPLQALYDRLQKVKSKFNEHKKLYEQFHIEIEKLNSDRENAEEAMNRLREMLEHLEIGTDGENSDGGVLDSVIDPVEENVLDPVKDKVLDPVKDNVLDPVKDNVLNPVKEKVLEPVLDPVTGKLLEPITGEVIDLVLDPASEKLLDPITGKVVVPIINPLTGKIINPLTGEIVKRVLNKETGELLNPYKDSFLKRILDKILNPLDW